MSSESQCIKRLLLAESEKKVWTERNRQRDVSMSADTPGWEGWRAMGWESDSEKS